MRIHVWAMGLAFGLAVFFLCAGCSQQDPGAQAGAVVEQEAGERAEAARSGAVAQAVDRAEKSAGVQDPGAGKAIEDAVDDPQISVKRSGPAERDAYEKARAKAKRQFGTAGDR